MMRTGSFPLWRWLCLLSASTVVWAQPNASAGASEIHILPVQGNVYMLVSAGGNVAVQIGPDGVLLVDAGTASMADQVYAAVRTLSQRPLRYIIDTNGDPDHAGGNEKLAKRGNTIAGGNVVGDIGQSASMGATVIAHENVLNRLNAIKPPLPFDELPTDTFASNRKNLFFDGEAVRVIHIPGAHTDGDSMVFFRRSDVLAVGDLFTPRYYPVIDLEHGGNVQGVIAALNRIIEITVPADKQEGGTYVIPGHGRLCDQADVVEYRDMLTIIRDRVQASIKMGMTLEQVRASKPTFDYDPQYGSATGHWTTDQFVEAVYRSLAAKPTARSTETR